MKTITDYPDDTLVTVKLYLDNEVMVEVAMHPDGQNLGMGVAITRWEDFSVLDARDLIRVCCDSLTRLLQRAHSIEVDLADLETVEQEEAPGDESLPF